LTETETFTSEELFLLLEWWECLKINISSVHVNKKHVALAAKIAKMVSP
jgi:hypothetical protein